MHNWFTELILISQSFPAVNCTDSESQNGKAVLGPSSTDCVGRNGGVCEFKLDVCNRILLLRISATVTCD